jgi:hypothetical protein
MECKKIKKICNSQGLCRVPREGTRQRFLKKILKALDKIYILKKIQQIFAECPNRGNRQRNFFKKIKNTLPSARAGALGKVIFLKKNLCRVPGQGHLAK